MSGSWNNQQGAKKGDPNKKLFIGGVPKDVSDEEFIAYFQSFGELVDCKLMRDSNQVGRGFGFITYQEQSAYDDVSQAQLFLRGKKLQAKRAIPPSEVLENQSEVKVFVGGLARDMDKSQLVLAFSQYGTVDDCIIMKDGITGMSRGFGFITFAASTSVDELLKNPKFEICGKMIECKRAQPASALNRFGGSGTSRGQYRQRGGAGFYGARGGYGQASTAPVNYGGQFGGYGQNIQFNNSAQNQFSQVQNYNSNLNYGQNVGGMVNMPLGQQGYSSSPAGFNQSNPVGYSNLGENNGQSFSYNNGVRFGPY